MLITPEEKLAGPLTHMRNDHEHDVHEATGWWVGSCPVCIADMVLQGFPQVCDHGVSMARPCKKCDKRLSAPAKKCYACADEHAKGLLRLKTNYDYTK